MIQRRIGAGAFGVVYEAYDREAASLVALKVLRFAQADALYRFKKDFRALADIRHPNLVSFYELLTQDGLWFFSMELVHGSDFIEALAGKPDFDRIRRVVHQLASGLEAVHRSGKVHRDIKPPNVLVTQEDRAVLLDFGLVTEFQRIGLPDLEPQTVGTPAYMSPEQALALPGSPASDWYSVGVMLYQALTGHLPFSGSALEIMADKQTGAPPAMADVPPDLEELCIGLLDPDPDRRLQGSEVLGRLQAKGSPGRSHPASFEAPFIGRQEILHELETAFAASDGKTVAVYLRGASGMGKSALIERFLARLDAAAEPADLPLVVLSGRCYLQESVPYKALDSLVDALSRYLTSLPKAEVAGLLTPQVAQLSVLFPVLLRVGPVADLGSEVLDPQTQRRRAFAGLRELLGKLASRCRLVLAIDDLQWGDIDSFLLLDEVLKPPDPPALLLIGAFRSEDEASSPFLRALSEHRESLRWRGVDVRELELGGLPQEQAAELVDALLGQAPEGAQDQTVSILREAAGSPLFLSQLAHFSQDRSLRSDFHLREVILARVAALPGPARRLLETVAVAGKPLDLSAARQAVDLASEGADALALLRARKLIRQSAAQDRDEIEAYHDRIRETVVESLSADDLRRIHRALALALESSGRADPETLAVHFQATREVARACQYAVTAAGRAEETLAFERAARLYRLALDLTPEDGPERYRLEVKLGEALANAGRSREAADTFLQAVEHSGTINPFEAQRHAAEKLLISGHIDRGMAILRHVLRTIDMRLEKRSWRALLDLWWHRLRLRLRGLQFDECPASDCDPELLRRIDVCWSVEVGLCLVDVLRASQFHARHLLLALTVGEPERVARGLAMEVFFGAMEGNASDEMLEQARLLAGRVRGRYATCLTEMAAGMLACSDGDWVEARRRLEVAEAQLREVRSGVAWELATVRHFRVLALLHLGFWPELFAELPRLLGPARKQGDLYLEIHLRHWVESLRDLARDRPDQAQTTLRQSIRDWSHTGFHFQHFGHLYAMAQVELYEGLGLEAWSRVRERWSELTGSMIQRIGMVLILSYDLRARCAVAAASEEVCTPGLRNWLLEQAERGAQRIERVGAQWPLGLAHLIRAGIESVRGRTDDAASHLRTAGIAFDDCSMVVHATMARWRLETSDDPEGAGGGRANRERIVADSDTRWLLAERGIVKPDRFAAVIVPGRWR
ncbi:MAG: protein kinase [Acidobacteriota bacterium]